MIKYFKYLLALLVFAMFTFFCVNAVNSYFNTAIFHNNSIKTFEKEEAFSRTIAIFAKSSPCRMQSFHENTHQLMTRAISPAIVNTSMAFLLVEPELNLYVFTDNLSVDNSLLNYGKPHASVSQPGVTKKMVFRFMAFKNKMTAVSLKPGKVYELFRHFKKSKNEMPVSDPDSGLTNGYPAIIIACRVSFHDAARKYKLLTSSYPAYGGDYMRFFLQPVSLEPDEIKTRDA